MPTNKYFACPFCKERFTKEDMIKHIEKKHESELPEGFTPLRVAFHAANRKDLKYRRPCRICRKPTEWDENKGRYNFLCENPACKKAWIENMKDTMGDKYGAYRPTESVEGLEKMLASRRISGKYKFSSGGEVPYTGSYEKKALEFMDYVLGVKFEDIEVPGPAIKYSYKNQEHIYIPDIYYRPYNLIIEIKDGGSNPNKHPGFSENRAKKIAKENHVIKHTNYNYLRLTDNNFSQLLAVFADLKFHLVNDDRNKVSHVNESTINIAEHMGIGMVNPIVGFTPGDAIILARPMNRVFGVTNSPNFEKAVTINNKGMLGFQKKEDLGDDYKEYVMKDSLPNIEKALHKFLGKELSESKFYELVFNHPQYSRDQLLFEDLIPYTDIEDKITQNIIESTVNYILEDNMDQYKSTFLSENDFKYNYNGFLSGKSDVLFISGIETKGKSEDVESIADQFGADVIHLDDIQKNYLYSDKKLREKHILIYKYFTDTEEGIEERRKNKKKDPEVDLYETIPNFLQFFLANREPNKKYIVEGPQLIELLAAGRIKFDILEKYSIIFKDTSFLQTKMQTDDIQSREKIFNLMSDYIDFIKDKVKLATFENLPNRLKKKVEDDKPLKDIVKDALGESTEELNFEDPKALLDHMKSFKYKNFDKLMSWEEVEEKKAGSCHDQVMYELHYLNNARARFLMEFREGSNQGGRTHSFVYYIDNGKLYWFENAWSGQEGIHGPYDSLNDLQKDIEEKMLKESDYDFVEFSDFKGKPGMTLQELVDICMMESTESDRPILSDTYFIKSSDGVDNACVDIQGYDHPCRGRSSMLILKFEDGEWKVFLSKDEEKDHEYHAPGGGWNKGESPKDAAIREAQEEVYINVKDVKYEGYLLEYHEEVQDWVREHVSDPKKWWYGYYSEIYVGMYDSKFTGEVEDRDKDQIANSGKWYNFKDIKDTLTPEEYREAIENYIMSSVNEACKDLSTARKFASEVKDLAKKYDANFYLVTDGASTTNNDGSNDAVKFARDSMKKWEEDHGFDSKEDWSNPLEESQDMSKLDKDHTTKEGYTFKYIDLESPEAEKYIKANGGIKEWRNMAKRAELAICNETDEIAGFIYVKKENGSIGPLKVLRKYRGYGISDKLLEDAIDKFDGKELGVYKDNEIALKLYNSHGFKVKEDHDTWQKMIKESYNDMNIESKYLEESDISQNTDKWNIGNNILFITGLTGSGKTVLAKDIRENYESYLINLDNVSMYYHQNYSNPIKHDKIVKDLQEGCPYIMDFFNTHNYTANSSLRDTDNIQRDFCNWFIENFSDTDKLYIIEGDLLPYIYPSNWFNDKPIIIKNNTYENICMRRASRNYRPNTSTSILESAALVQINNKRLRSYYNEMVEFANTIISKEE